MWQENDEADSEQNFRGTWPALIQTLLDLKRCVYCQTSKILHEKTNLVLKDKIAQKFLMVRRHRVFLWCSKQ